jgi:hypothetical protein
MELTIIALVTAAVTFVVVVTTTVIYANKAISIQKDYNSKITTAQESELKYNKQQDASISSTNQTIQNVQNEYSKKSDLAQSLTTGTLSATNINSGRLQASSITASEGISSSSLNTGQLNAQNALFGDFNSFAGNVGLLSASSITGNDHTFVDPNSGAMGGIGFVNQDLKVIAPAGTSLGFGYYDEQNNKVNDAITIGANLNTAFAGGLTVAENSTFNKNLNVLGQASINGDAVVNGKLTVKKGDGNWNWINVVGNHNDEVLLGSDHLNRGIWANGPRDFTIYNQGKAGLTVDKDGGVKTTGGVQVTKNEPGPLVEKNYGSPNNRYGVGQFPGANMRMYTAGGGWPATVNLSIAKADGSFDDVVKVDNSRTAIVDGKLTVKKGDGTWNWIHVAGNQNDNVYLGSDHINRGIWADGPRDFTIYNQRNAGLTVGQDGGVKTTGGVQVTKNEPGPLVEKNYGSPDNRYGVGQFTQGNMRMYTAGGWGPASVNLSIARAGEGEGKFDDIVKVKTDGSTSVSGDINIGGVETVKTSTAPVGTDWFRLNNANINNAQNQGVAIHNGMAVNGGGGLSVGAWTKVPEGQAYIRDRLKVAHNFGGGWVDNSVMSAFKPNNNTTVGASFGGPDHWSHFPWLDGDTYVRSGKANGNVFVSDIGTGKLVLGSSTQGASIETRAPIKVQGLNPGPLIEKDYGANQNKYGIGQFSNGEMRLYAPKVSSTATVNMSLLNTDGSYDDVITVNANNRNTRINGNFVVAGGNTAQINGTLRVCDNAGNNCRTI